MKNKYLFVFFFSVFTYLNAQDWIQNPSSLYFYSDHGKVPMEVDYSSAAVYFKNAPSLKTVELFKSKMNALQAKGSVAPTIEVLGNKGIMRVSDFSALPSLKSSADRQAFLKSYIDTEEAYEILPSFQVDGIQAWMTKRVTLQLADNIAASDIQATLNKYEATLVKDMLKGKMLLFQVDNLENQLPMIQELAEAGFIEWGTPDFMMELELHNDPLYQYQWHLHNTGGTDYDGNFNLTTDVDIDAPEAWEITKGSSDITVAVIDDGMNAHEDFPSLLQGYTPSNNGNGAPESDAYHGVPCGGLIFAQHNNIGVMGVAPDVNAFSVNIFASGTSNADVADGIIWAVDQGADVLSNSWGFSTCTGSVSSITAAFQYAATEGRNGLGCVILVASGNNYYSCVGYPANLSTVTAVGAVNGQGNRSAYSNYGSDLDISAPSNDIGNGTFVSDIVTTDIAGSGGNYTGNYYYAFGGTSAATPIAAGVACLVLSVDPTLSKSQVENILYDSAVDYGSSGFDNIYGHGLVNAYNAVVAAGGTVPSGDNLAFEKPASQSTTTYNAPASRAVDGITSGNWGDGSITHTASGVGQWWKVDLGTTENIGEIILFNRTNCCMQRLNNVTVTVEDINENVFWSETITSSSATTLTVDAEGVSGRVIRVTQNQDEPLSLAEVEVYGFEGDIPTIFPDPTKKYYIDAPIHNLRIAASGSSEDPYTTSTGTTGDEVEWKFVAKGNGYWHIQKVAGGTKPRLRSNNTEYADMQPTSSSGGWTYYELTEGFIEGTYFVTLPNGPTNYKRLQVNNSGEVKMVSTASNRTWESFTFTEAGSITSSSLEDSIEIERLDTLAEEDLQIYPNPVKNNLTISLGNSLTITKVEIIDVIGKTHIKELTSGASINLDVSRLNGGLYLIRLYDTNKTIHLRKIVKE